MLHHVGRLDFLALGVSLVLSFSCAESYGIVPCDSYELECQNPGKPIQTEPICINDSPLRISVGEGEDSLTLLNPGQPPTFHTGFQQGEHVYLGFRLYEFSDKGGGVEGDITLANSDETLTFHIFSDEALDASVEGIGDMAGFVIVSSSGESGSPGRIAVSVQDRCGREASLEHDFFY